MKNFLNQRLMILNKNEKEKFIEYLPNKVYKTERNIAIIVVLTQLSMICMFLFNNQISFDNNRGTWYFCLYVFLFITTLMAIFSYRYTFNNKKTSGFLWTRRIYSSVLCIWVLGITYLEQMHGKGGSTYCYLLPTMAAVLLLTPIESTIIFGSTWLGMACMFIFTGTSRYLFSNMVNSIFVAVLTLFISYRYYQSMAVEFCDRNTISLQYQEIEKSNDLLQKIAHVDQLTNLYNRRFLIDKLYPLFDDDKQKDYFGIFIMMDIDYFKHYNDNYGHIQGDACLRQISSKIKKLCDDQEATAIRYGGEEFLIIKMTQTKIDGQVFAKQLLDTIREANIKRDDIEFDRVTVSIGLWNDSLTDITHIEKAIRYADNALYEAKKNGRNCIIESKEASIPQ